MGDSEDAITPDWTVRRQAGDISGSGYLLRASDDDDAPWKLVRGSEWGFWTEGDTQTHYMSFVFMDGTERVFNQDDEVEIGMIKPPWTS